MILLQIRSSKSLLFMVVIVGILSVGSHSLRFNLDSGHTKCIAEDTKSNSMSVGVYSVVNTNLPQSRPSSHKITVKVMSADGKSYHNMERVEYGKFAFTSVTAGDYVACFTAIDHKPVVTLTIDFDWKTGIHAKDWSNIAKKGQVEFMEVELKKLQDTVTSIHEEMFYLREREEEMQKLNRSTNSKMARLSLLSIVVCLAVAGLQIWHLKNFFERKKII